MKFGRLSFGARTIGDALRLRAGAPCKPHQDLFLWEACVGPQAVPSVRLRCYGLPFWRRTAESESSFFGPVRKAFVVVPRDQVGPALSDISSGIVPTHPDARDTSAAARSRAPGRATIRRLQLVPWLVHGARAD